MPSGAMPAKQTYRLPERCSITTCTRRLTLTPWIFRWSYRSGCWRRCEPKRSIPSTYLCWRAVAMNALEQVGLCTITLLVFSLVGGLGWFVWYVVWSLVDLKDNQSAWSDIIDNLRSEIQDLKNPKDPDNEKE